MDNGDKLSASKVLASCSPDHCTGPEGYVWVGGWWTWCCRLFLNDCPSNTASLWEEESIKGNGNLLTIKILELSVCRGQEST